MLLEFVVRFINQDVFGEKENKTKRKLTEQKNLLRDIGTESASLINIIQMKVTPKKSNLK